MWVDNESDREATYVLVFVEDVERFDGRHRVGVYARASFSLRQSEELWSSEQRGNRGCGCSCVREAHHQTSAVTCGA